MSRLLGSMLGAVSTSGTASPAQWLVDWIRGGAPSAAGIPVDEHKALTYSAYWFGVRLISEAVSSLPLFLYRRLGGGGSASCALDGGRAGISRDARETDAARH